MSRNLRLVDATQAEFGHSNLQAGQEHFNLRVRKSVQGGWNAEVSCITNDGTGRTMFATAEKRKDILVWVLSTIGSL